MYNTPTCKIENPVKHYLEMGWKEGMNPGPRFNGNRYLQSNRDLAGKDINPLVHYEVHGKYEGRKLHYFTPGSKLKKIIPTCESPKKIVLLSHELTYTGAPLSLLKIAEILCACGYEVTLISLSRVLKKSKWTFSTGC